MNVDHESEAQFEDWKQDCRENKVPFIEMESRNTKRAIQECQVHDMMGEHYIWSMPIMKQAMDIIKKMNYIGGPGVVLSDRKYWSNSKGFIDHFKDVSRLNNWKSKRQIRISDRSISRAVDRAIELAINNRNLLGEVYLSEFVEDRESTYKSGMVILSAEGQVSDV